MGILGDEGEFNRLLCPCWQAACLGRAVIGWVVWGAAAGVRGERLGENAAAVLHSGQKVKLWLQGLPTGHKTLAEVKWQKTKHNTHVRTPGDE